METKEECININPTTGIGKALQIVKVTMKKVDHALYRGEVYCKAKKGKCFRVIKFYSKYFLIISF